MSSAAIVSGGCGSRRRPRPRGSRGSRWWHTISMSRCSSSVLTVKGRVGLVDDGSTFGSPRDPDDVGRMAAAGALGVEGVDGAALEGGDGVLDEARSRSACRCGSPPARRSRRRRAGSSRWRPASCPSPRAASGRRRRPRSARRSGVRQRWRCPCRGSRSSSGRPRPPAACARGARAPGVQVVALVPVGRAGAAAEHRGDAGDQRLLDLLRADEVDVRVDAAGGEDLALAGDGLGARADDDVDARLDVRVAGLADARRCGRPSGRRRP